MSPFSAPLVPLVNIKEDSDQGKQQVDNGNTNIKIRL